MLDPAVRVAKPAHALRRGGALPTITTHHVAGGDEDFFLEAQACYERWDPETPEGGIRQRSLLTCMAKIIDSRYGGRVRKAYLNELRVAHRRPD